MTNTYFIGNQSGKMTATTESAFRAISDKAFYIYAATNGDCLAFPFSLADTDEKPERGFVVITAAGERRVTEAVYRQIVAAHKADKAYCAKHGVNFEPQLHTYKSGNENKTLYAVMSVGGKNRQICSLTESGDSSVEVRVHRQNRCADPCGRECRYCRDENDKIIIGENGKPVGARCSECPRAAANREECAIADYDRINCCARFTCGCGDCRDCLLPKTDKYEVSYEGLAGYGADAPSDENVCERVIRKEMFAALRRELEPMELALVKHRYIDGIQDVMAFVRKYHPDVDRKTEKTLHQRYSRLLNGKLQDKLADILADYRYN